jgi:CheY-like chemotaxis protein
MASILLVEDGPGTGRQLTSLLAAAGHRVLCCGGGPTPLAACPLLRQGRCPLADAAQLLIFGCPLGLPLRSRSYRGIHLLRAYRAHPDYGRLPLVLVAVAPPHDLEGPGPIELVETFTDPAAVLAAVNRLLPTPGHPPIPSAADPDNMGRRRRPGEQGDRRQQTSEAVSVAGPGTAGRCRRGAGPRPPTGSSAAHHTTARLRRWRSCSCSPGS